jgi:hypothetical protein
MSFPHLQRSLSLLNPWLIQLDLDASSRMESRNDQQMNYIFENLFHIEHNMAGVTINSNQLDIAEGHFQQCLVYYRRYGLEGEDKTTNIFVALIRYSKLRQRQRDYSGAVIFAEETCNLVVEAYDPVHPQGCWDIDRNSNLEGRLI